MDSSIRNQGKRKGKSVQKRLKKGYIIILAFMAACMVISVIALLKISADYKFAINNYGFSQGYVGQLGIEFNSMTTHLRSIILETDNASISEFKATLNEERQNFNDYLKQVRDIANTNEEYKMIDEMETVATEFYEITEQVMALAAQNKNEEAYALLRDKAVQQANIIKNNINSILALNIKKCNDTMEAANVLSIILIIVISILAVIAIIVGMKLSVSVSKSICDPLDEVKMAAEKLKAGELDITIEYHGEDELGELSESFREACNFMKAVIKDASNILKELAIGNFRIKSSDLSVYKGEFVYILENMRALRDQMTEALINVQEASNQVSAGASQMAESSQNLAEGATEQAGAVQELMATIENVSEMVSESAKGAEKAYQQAMEYEEEAGKSSEAMSDLMEAMEKINTVSKQIGNIIAEIEDIASQTNLLSLNASIEAARAGEAGKGFAVVADQIGKLASDSARSAVNTRQLIENSIKEVERGNQITGKTSDALNKVVTGIKKLGENAKESSQTAQSQAEFMRQIEQGIEQIASVVQNNSAAAEETSATSEELSAQAISLNEEVEKFQLYRK